MCCSRLSAWSVDAILETSYREVSLVVDGQFYETVYN